MNTDARCVVIGGYVNGFGVIQSLHEAGITDIHLVGLGSPQARHSRRIRSFTRLEASTDEALLAALRTHSEEGRILIPYPTHDTHVEFLARHASEISDFCFLPVNETNALQSLDKTYQYEVAASVGVAVPASVTISSPSDLHALNQLRAPIIIKPTRSASRDGSALDSEEQPFRNVVIRLDEAVPAAIHAALAAGWSLVASEIIPGPDTAIYAYTAYRSRSGELLRGWGGRKLGQHPQGFGVYSSASNETVEGLCATGIRVIEGLDAYGIVEPEFKLDPRTGELVLMEVNLRSMMWHRVGALCGVNLPEAQYLDALGKRVPGQTPNPQRAVHAYFGHEFANLIADPTYRNTFRANVCSSDNRHWAFWDWRDPLPFFASLRTFAKLVVKACVSRFRRG